MTASRILGQLIALHQGVYEKVVGKQAGMPTTFSYTLLISYIDKRKTRRVRAGYRVFYSCQSLRSNSVVPFARLPPHGREAQAHGLYQRGLSCCVLESLW